MAAIKVIAAKAAGIVDIQNAESSFAVNELSSIFWLRKKRDEIKSRIFAYKNSDLCKQNLGNMHSSSTQSYSLSK